MEYRKFGNTYVVRLNRGEEIISSLSELAEKEDIRLAKIEGIGAADQLTVGLYDVPSKQYSTHEYNKAFEITSLTGNITRKDDKPYLHVHLSAGDVDNHVIGGHLNRARIGGTAEIFVTVLDGEVGRKMDDITDTGLNVFDFH
ncbi:MAG: PPC domain-containing DNA-binding protein [Eubacteriales bacterium]|jgi:predicted DNA-binding protein with PD1-like motif